MPAQDYLDQMQNAANMMPATARLRLVLDELLAMVNTGRISFRETGGSASTVGTYKPKAAPVLWGANVTFKSNELPSFVHELTHARCILCFRADTVNYAPGGVNHVAEAFGATSVEGAPVDTVCLTTQCQIDRRLDWFRPHCKVFLDNNLENLRAWADATDYTPPEPFMTAQKKAEVKRTEKSMNKGNATAMTRFGELGIEAKLYGQVQKSRKWRGADAINAQRLQDEKDRKKAWISERINYGLNGMGGMGDTHNEYDTVINQMLFQMFLWGFRTGTDHQLSMVQLAQHARDSSLPPEYLYDRLSSLAHEAHLRRMAANGINNGAPPTIIKPPVVGV